MTISTICRFYYSRKTVLSVLFFLLVFYLNAQQNTGDSKGKIIGRVVDSVSGKPIDYATISLLTQNDGKVVNGITTDEAGIFKLDKVA